MRGVLAAAASLAACSASAAGAALADPPGKNLPVTIGRICTLIETHAGRNAAAAAISSRG